MDAGNCLRSRFQEQSLQLELKRVSMHEFGICHNSRLGERNREEAFFNSKMLASITLPVSIESLDTNLFFECENLLVIQAVGETQNFQVVNDVLFNKEMT